MTKKNFLHLMVLVAGVLVFGVGLCMCLMPEWNAFKPGVAVTALGILVLLVLAVIRWISAGKPGVRMNWKKVGKIAYCVASLLVLGAGMAMIMSFEGMMIPGILVGIAGIIMVLGMIPVLKGLK